MPDFVFIYKEGRYENDLFKYGNCGASFELKEETWTQIVKTKIGSRKAK